MKFETIDKILTNPNMAYVPWYVFGVIFGSISFFGTSGISLIYTIFIVTLVLSCFLRSRFDYLVNYESNYVINNSKDAFYNAKIELPNENKKVANKNLRVIYTASCIFRFLSLCAFIIILSITVNSFLFWNTELMYSALTHAIIGAIIYKMVTFLLDIMSFVKVKVLS